MDTKFRDTWTLQYSAADLSARNGEVGWLAMLGLQNQGWKRLTTTGRAPDEVSHHSAALAGVSQRIVTLIASWVVFRLHMRV